MEDSAAYGAMVLIQVSYAAGNIILKIAFEKGLNQLVFVVYRHIIGALLLGPLAYVLERNHRPPLSFSLMIKIFLLSSFGTTIHFNLLYAGFRYTSPTVVVALANVIPSLTFLIAAILRMESVNITSARGQAKVLGTLVCIGGALTFTFWKGRCIFNGFSLINVCSTNGSACKSSHVKDWLKGTAFILTSYIAWSLWLILQAVVSKVYPARLSLNALICFFASLQSSFLAPFMARNPALWKLEWNIQLLTIIYAGVVLTAVMYNLQTWCITKKGPVFSAIFIPLQLMIIGTFSAFAFAERLHLGSLVGALLIILGLYSVLWAKSAENITSHCGKGFEDKKMVKISINETASSSVPDETK